MVVISIRLKQERPTRRTRLPYQGVACRNRHQVLRRGMPSCTVLLNRVYGLVFLRLGQPTVAALSSC